MADYEHKHRLDSWGETQKRYLEYFKQMTVLNTASIGGVLLLGGGAVPLSIPLPALIISELGFSVSLLFSMFGMYLVVENSPELPAKAEQRRRASFTQALSALTFVAGAFIALIATMYAQMAVWLFWGWIIVLAIVFGVLIRPTYQVEKQRRDTALMREVLSTCNRRALVTRTDEFTRPDDAALNLDAMFQSLAQCRLQLQSIIARIVDEEHKQLVAEIIEQLYYIEQRNFTKLGSDSGSHGEEFSAQAREIDEAKTKIIELLNQISNEIGLGFAFSPLNS